MEAAYVSTERGMDEKDVVYILHDEILFSHKKEEILPFVTTWMNLDDTTQREIS